MTGYQATDRDSLLGTVVGGRYTIEAELGRGGMGVVYAARHNELGRPLAIKVLNAVWATTPEAVERFLREARTASSLHHPNIVDVSDLGRLPDGRPYLVMPRIAGTDLSTLVRTEGPQSPRRVTSLLQGVASALDHVHARGFVHRDIKLENLMHVVHDDGLESVLVLDFGIAAALITGTRITSNGLICGTPQVLPPEAALGGLPDRRGDVYSLATAAFELMCGVLPFEDDNPVSLLQQKIARDAPSMSEASGRDFPGSVETVIACALSREPSRRHASAGEFARALKVATEQVGGDFVEAASAVRLVRRPPPSTPVPAPGNEAAFAPTVATPMPAQGEPVPAAAPPPPAPDERPSAVSGPPRLLLEDDVSPQWEPRESNWLPYTLLLIGVAAWVMWWLSIGGAEVVESLRTGQDGMPAKSAAEGNNSQPETASAATTASEGAGTQLAGSAANPSPASPDKTATTDGERSKAPPEKRDSRTSAVDNKRRGLAHAPRFSSPQPPEAPEPPPAPPPPAPLDEAGEEHGDEERVIIMPSAIGPEVAAPSDSEPEVAAPPDLALPTGRAREVTGRAQDALLRGDLATANQLFAQAVELDPNDAGAWRGRGLVLQAMHRHGEAARAFRTFLRLQPTGPQADRVRARLQEVEGAR